MLSSATSNNARPAVNNVDTLVHSGKAVEQVIIRDQDYPDLLNLLTGPTSDMYIKPLIHSTEDLIEISRIPTPAHLLNKIKETKYRSFHGVLPEIGRAWLTVDHQFFIWNYNNPSEIYEYNDQDQIIITLGLVKPKAGIFSDKISHLLVLSTPLQVIVLALTVTATELKVFATEMSAPTDDAQYKTIKGTEDGRIFMVSHNGKLGEFVYYNNTWSKRVCVITSRVPTTSALSRYLPRRKIELPQIKSLAIDDERKLLYILTSTSIEVVDIGNPQNDYKSIFKHTNIVQNATQMCRQSSRSYSPEDFSLESVHIISTVESKKIHLMAITTAGFRLYFSTYKDASRQNLVMNTDNVKITPSTLELVHVRLPPAEVQQTIPGQLTEPLRYTYYDCGICLSINPVNEDIDSIYCTSVAPNNVTAPQQPVFSNMTSYNQIRNVYIETVSKVNTPSKTWQLTESRTELRGKRPMKEISQQLSDAPRQFIALTSNSLVFYNKLRPVDTLLRIIQNRDRTLQEQQKDYEAFFERYGKTESCAMCLSIICNTDSPDVVKRMTDLFFESGGSPVSANSSQIPGNHLGQVVGQTGIIFSGRHDGFLLYFARLLTPIWKLKIFEICHPKNPKASIDCTKIQSLLYEVRNNLHRLKHFMDVNSQFHHSANISDPRFQATDRSKLELDLAEQKSVRDLYMLLAQSIDAVYFVEFLLDSRVNNILTKDRQADNYLNQILELDISSLLTSNQGRELANDLVIMTIQEYGSSHTHACFDVVSHQLEKSCTNFFGSKDILFFKGMEYVSLAVKTETEFDRKTYIKQALENFKQAADNISVPKFEAICQFLINYSYHVGIIELALERAHKLDIDGQAVSVYEERQTTNDAKNAILRACLESYDFALVALSDVLRFRNHAVPPGRIPIEDPAVYQRNVIDTAIKSRDKLFHYKLYGWFMEKGLKEELLTMETPYLVSFFENYVTDEETSLGFLWEYYRNRDRYFQSAACLVKLARSSSPKMLLDYRINYLTYASVNAKSEINPGPSQIVFYANLEQMLEDGSLQKRLQGILRSADTVEAHLAADEMDRVLMSRAELYEKYGKQFHILESVFSENR